jgi:hypothetical protein
LFVFENLFEKNLALHDFANLDLFFKYYKKLAETCEIGENLTGKNIIREKLSNLFNYNNDGNGLID